jgi:hypothetical protein
LKHGSGYGLEDVVHDEASVLGEVRVLEEVVSEGVHDDLIAGDRYANDIL